MSSAAGYRAGVHRKCLKWNKKVRIGNSIRAKCALARTAVQDARSHREDGAVTLPTKEACPGGEPGQE